MPKQADKETRNPDLLPRARELRREMTKQERQLWYGFLKDYPVKFYKQRVICSYITDFYCASAKLIIELDGSQHYSEEGREYDERRTAVFEKYGLRVLRFTNLDINHEFEAVAMMIAREVEGRIKLLTGEKEKRTPGKDTE